MLDCSYERRILILLYLNKKVIMCHNGYSYYINNHLLILDNIFYVLSQDNRQIILHLFIAIKVNKFILNK